MLYRLVRPLLFTLDPESAHHFTFSIAKFAQSLPLVPSLLRKHYNVKSPLLETDICGVRIENPVGIAAGFDKNAVLVPLLSTLGFGLVEIGSVSHQAREGNPRPRLFRLPNDKALINRMGLNNVGPAGVRRNLSSIRRDDPVVVATNIVKTHDPNILGSDGIEDIVNCYAEMHDSSKLLVLNISCPNTREGKTFEEPAALSELLDAVAAKRKELSSSTPLFVKFSPDLDFAALDTALGICEDHGIDGYVMCNTSNKRDGLTADAEILQGIGAGGLSGPPIRAQATSMIRHAYQQLGGSKPIIGVGGIDSAETAYEMIRAGASAIELYTGLIYQGPALAKQICQGLIEYLQRDGYNNVAQAVGADAVPAQSNTMEGSG